MALVTVRRRRAAPPRRRHILFRRGERGQRFDASPHLEIGVGRLPA